MSIDQINKDFFKDCKELVITVNESEPINLFFGLVGCRYYDANDVTIIPHADSRIKVILKLNDKKSQPTEFESVKPVTITQRIVEPYPSFALDINGFSSVKLQRYEGVIKIQGNSDVIQKRHQIYDC
jgi:hypothetical protein